jgi:predicted permease
MSSLLQISVLIQDLKLSIRGLRRQPAFTAIAVLTLAVGIGVNAVAFTVVNGVLFKHSALRVSDEMGRVATLPGGDEGGYASLVEYERFAAATGSALDLAAEGRSSMAWRHDGTTETAWVLFVSPNYFTLIDAAPVAGRIVVGRAAGGLPSVVVGERFWRRKLRGASLAGLTLQLNETMVSVAGVLPESFTGPAGIYSPDVWLPLEDLPLFRTSPALQKRDQRWLFLFGRLRPGAAAPEVQARLDAAAADMARDWPVSHRDRTARFRLFREGNRERRGLSTAAAVAMGIIGLVLLLACFNVANLLLARAVERERDMAVRAAIGASVTRLARFAVTEGFVIAGFAGLASVVLASWTQSLVSSFAIPIEQPQHIDVAPDATVIAFVGILVVIAGVLPGLWPALAVARADVVRILGSHAANPAAGHHSRLGRWLVGAQVAGSTAFLVIAALFIQSYGTVSLADLGFDRDRLIVAEFEPASHGYDVERSEQYVQALLARVGTLPGVTDAALADRVPFFIGFDRLTPVSSPKAPCEPSACPAYATLAVGGGYFRTMGIPLTAGREFTGADAHEAIVNQPLARLLWPDGRGVGETLRIGDRAVAVTVVGITARTHTRGLDREQPTLYVPFSGEHLQGPLSVVTRTEGAPEGLVRPFEEAARALDHRVAIVSVKTMEERIAVQLWPFRTVSWLFSICGALALLLAAVGLAALVIHAVKRRRREFGVRLAVGATPGDLVADVLRRSAALLVPGLVAGTALAALAARLVQAAFVGVNVLNPLTYVAVAVIECAIVLVACVGPALGASRVDPLVALRSE